jgi:arylsulfatase
MRAPNLFKLRSDSSGQNTRQVITSNGLLNTAQAIVTQHLRTFQEFPPRQRPGTFSIDQVMEKLMNPRGTGSTTSS